MVFHRRHPVLFLLYTPAVVISDVIIDGSDKDIYSLEFFSLEYSTETFHRVVVYAMGNSRYLCSFINVFLLEATVAMVQQISPSNNLLSIVATSTI